MTYEICRSSDDGTCRIWDARNSHNPRIYVPRPLDAINGQIIAYISVNWSVLELVVVWVLHFYHNKFDMVVQSIFNFCVGSIRFY